MASGGKCVPRVTHNISACLLVKEDNHKMVEWIAYHHYTLPLTRVIVCEEQGNKEYVRDQFAGTAWKDRVQFEFLRAGVDVTNFMGDQQEHLTAVRCKNENSKKCIWDRVSRYLKLQRACYEGCMQRLKSTGATWTLFLDSDEFLVVKNTTGTRPGGANSLQPLLNSCPFSNQSCVYLPRVMFNNDTQEPADLYETRKYRQHLSRDSKRAYDMLGKTLLDVSRLSPADMQVGHGPHISISSACANTYAAPERMGNILMPLHRSAYYNSAVARQRAPAEVNHYVGDRKSFLYRSGDKRYTDRDAEYLKKVTHYGFGHGKQAGIVDEDDDLRTWMDEFEQEWNSGGLKKLPRNSNLSFASLMDGLGMYKERPPALSATTHDPKKQGCSAVPVVPPKHLRAGDRSTMTEDGYMASAERLLGSTTAMLRTADGTYDRASNLKQPLEGHEWGNKVILDFGCGSGRLLTGLQAAGVCYTQYIGVEVNSSLITYLEGTYTDTTRHRFVKVDTRNAQYNPRGVKLGDDADGLGYELDDLHSAVDIIVVHSVLSHMVASDIQKHLRGFAKLLTPETGRLVVSLFVQEDGEPGEEPPRGTSVWGKLKKSASRIVYASKASVERMMRNANLRVVHAERWTAAKGEQTYVLRLGRTKTEPIRDHLAPNAAAAPPLGRCERWCHTHATSGVQTTWAVRCAWKTNACLGCADCAPYWTAPVVPPPPAAI